MKERIKKRYTISIGRVVYHTAPVILVMLFEILGLLNYNMADDYIMNTISAGFNTGNPNEHIVFINGIYGVVVKCMYKFIPEINWFGVGYIITMLLCIYCLMMVISKKKDGYIPLIVVVIIETVSLLWMTFTVIAYLCVVTGIIILADVNFDCKQNNRYKIKMVIALLVEFLGITFRADAFFSGIILCVPLLVWFINKKNAKKYLFFFMMLVLLFVLSKVTDNVINDSRTMKEYKSYNTARSNVLDFPMKGNKEINGISETDYKLLEKWVLSDKEVFSESLFKDISKQMNITEKYNFNFINIVIQMLKLKECWFFLCIIIILLIQNKNSYKYYVVQAIVTYGIVAATFFRNRPAHRVIVPLFVIGTTCELYYYFKNETNVNRVNKTVLRVLIVILPLIALYFKMEYGIYKENTDINRRYAEVKEFVQNDKGTLYLTSELGNLLYHNSIVDTKTDYVYDNIIGLGDWNIYNDVYYSVVRKYNLTDDDRLIIDLVCDSNIKCILKESDDIVELLKKHIEEQTGKNVEYKITKRFNKSGTAIYEYSLEN